MLSVAKMHQVVAERASTRGAVSRKPKAAQAPQSASPHIIHNGAASPYASAALPAIAGPAAPPIISQLPMQRPKTVAAIWGFTLSDGTVAMKSGKIPFNPQPTKKMAAMPKYDP